MAPSRNGNIRSEWYSRRQRYRFNSQFNEIVEDRGSRDGTEDIFEISEPHDYFSEIRNRVFETSVPRDYFSGISVRWLHLVDDRWLDLPNDHPQTRRLMSDSRNRRTAAVTNESRDDANARGEESNGQTSGTLDAGDDCEEGEIKQQEEGPQSSQDEKPGEKGVKPAWAFR